ncbi:MAG: DUF1156 domain-containing protein [Deltaproteobacteria bacterium]|nr:DUF1156 domain-containing protein [Deltaproteobacteria bacterium]
MFLTRYIEKYGTGTLMMIDQSAAAGLPPPTFEPREAEFLATLWRDWLTAKALAMLDLSERQKKAIDFNDKRPIEDYLPIQVLSAEAAREKSVRKGHISTLHLRRYAGRLGPESCASSSRRSPSPPVR